ncbi:MAG: DEAD/DEAH box helicase [Spongiibacteraceae bacterium]|jgi:ATP-dependent RNA helicase DeaD|nr:DEAD/DEAH box helicase [Spongiibacteraceae bacterium]
MTTDAETFAGLGLPELLLQTVTELGYEKPSPIQARAIPPLLSGSDLIGQAQTGTGKTAAFALPMLANIDPEQRKPQALVLAPTRELAMQVAEAFTRYSANMPNCKVLAVYGGQGMRDQLRELSRGVQIVVGTPGRLLDHLERKSLDLSALKWVVLDEADEMLRMGFIDDVEAILGHTGGTQQTALFSATMPPRIKQIAERYLREPQHVVIPAATRTNAAITQQVVWVRGREKPIATARLLAVENCDATIIFARTREATTELAEVLSGYGHATAAINGDLNQAQREQTISLLKQGKIDVLVATDVAARGLDVERISHVINYDMPHDFDTYVHRIGRTGRAGRNGKAILLADPRERRQIRMLEQATRQPLQELTLPTDDELDAARLERFRLSLADHLPTGAVERWQPLLNTLCEELDQPPAVIAAGLVGLLAQQQGLTRKLPNISPVNMSAERPRRERDPSRPRRELPADVALERYRLAVGRTHQVRVGDIVGAIANEAGIDSQHIGRIQLHDDFTLVDLPAGMPGDVFEHLRGVRVRGRPLELRRWHDEPGDHRPRRERSEQRPRREGGDERPRRAAAGGGRPQAGASAPVRRLSLKR